MDGAIAGADAGDRMGFLVWSVVAWVVTLSAAVAALALLWLLAATVTAVARAVA